MTERVTVDIQNHVAHVQLSRPEKMNALDGDMFEAITETGRALSADPDLRCVVLSGKGRAFCAGIDTSRFSGGKSGESISTAGASSLLDRTHGLANRPQYAAWVWHEMPVPVIAAVHGVAFGGGFQIMLGADVRFIAPDTRLSIMEIKWGLVPDMSGMALTKGLVRNDILRELTYSGRIFSGTEAGEYGFATQVVTDPLEQALKLAAVIAGKSPTAIEAAKRIFNATPDLSDAEILMMESNEQQALRGGHNQTEAARAELEKRAPQFVSPRAPQN